MKKALIISIIVNILFFLFGGYAIQKKGGVDYIKRKINSQEVTINSVYRIHYETKLSFFRSMPNEANEIIFLGDSLTELCDWNELLGKNNLKNRGIDGDVINGVIERIDEVVSSNPQKIFLMIGTNDLAQNRTIDQILIDFREYA